MQGTLGIIRVMKVFNRTGGSTKDAVIIQGSKIDKFKGPARIDTVFPDPVFKIHKSVIIGFKDRIRHDHFAIIITLSTVSK
jgi:hypothetical protein